MYLVNETRSCCGVPNKSFIIKSTNNLGWSDLLNPINILVVDDDKDFQNLIVAALQDEG